MKQGTKSYDRYNFNKTLLLRNVAVINHCYVIDFESKLNNAHFAGTFEETFVTSLVVFEPVVK